MNDFSEIENELKKLQPKQASAEFLARVERAMAGSDEAEEKIIRPQRFHFSRAALGFGLAAAAVLLLFIQVNFERGQRKSQEVVQTSPAPNTKSTSQRGATSVNQFIPADATQVVYNRRDDGLQFASDSAQPVRRLRYLTQQTLQWRNPATGASLRVSYPSEEVVFIPVSGQ